MDRRMEKDSIKLPQCAECNVRDKTCIQENGHGPDFYPTVNLTHVVRDSLKEYRKAEIKKFALCATIQEGECYTNRGTQHPYVVYPTKTRIQETIEFANKLDFKRLGIAFCGGLRNEARILSEILKAQGFEVASVICTVERTPKEFIGI
jgi:uncharacterized metal-binding protein